MQTSWCAGFQEATLQRGAVFWPALEKCIVAKSVHGHMQCIECRDRLLYEQSKDMGDMQQQLMNGVRTGP